MKSNHLYPEEFQLQALQTLHRVMELCGSAFYLVDPDMRQRGLGGVALHKLAPEVEDQYQQRFKESDPLKPENFRKSNNKLAVLDEEISFSELQQSAYYQEFMLPLNHRHVVDLFFRQDQEIIAVATLLRSEQQGPFKPEEIKLLEQLQPFIEYTLNTIYQPERFNQRELLQQRYKLTQREFEVLELIVAGQSNKQIAKDLQLGLSTVKTHLLHIFQKSQVNSRTELLSLIINDLQSPPFG